MDYTQLDVVFYYQQWKTMNPKGFDPDWAEKVCVSKYTVDANTMKVLKLEKEQRGLE